MQQALLAVCLEQKKCTTLTNQLCDLGLEAAEFLSLATTLVHVTTMLQKSGCHVNMENQHILVDAYTLLQTCWLTLHEWLALIASEVPAGSHSFDSITPGALFTGLIARLPPLVHGLYLCARSDPGLKLMLRAESTPSCDPPWQMEKLFGEHAPVFQAILRADTTQLFSHFAFLLEHPSLLAPFTDVVHAQPLPERREWLYSNLSRFHQVTSSSSATGLSTMVENSFSAPTLTVSRARVIESSCKKLGGLSTEQLRRDFSVQFDDEAGMV